MRLCKSACQILISNLDLNYQLVLDLLCDHSIHLNSFLKIQEEACLLQLIAHSVAKQANIQETMSQKLTLVLSEILDYDYFHFQFSSRPLV